MLALVLAIFLFPAALSRSTSLTQLESAQKQLSAMPASPYLFLGNCALDGRIDPNLFSQLAGGVPTRILTQDGDMSVVWYLILKNLIISSGVRPRQIYLFFEQNDLTLPMERITLPRERLRIANFSVENELILQQILIKNRNFMDKVGEWLYTLYPVQLASQYVADAAVHHFGMLVAQPELGPLYLQKMFSSEEPNLLMEAQSRKVRQMVNHRLSPEFRRRDSDNAGQFIEQPSVVVDPALVASFDFAKQLPKSVLPEIIRMAEEAGLHMVFVHFEPPPSIFHVPGPPPEVLATYKRDLSAYVRQHGMDFIDMTDVPGVEKFRHRSYYVLMPEERPGYTRFFANLVAAKNLN
ncbi:MAG: hypothetical protein G8345_13405 [Magnetococcales bacterium]|nr:hypothetical protein [Magnetococcales bacterium]